MCRWCCQGKGILTRVAAGPADDPQLPAVSPAAEEPVAAVGFEPGYPYAGRQIEAIQHFAGFGIDSPQVCRLIQQITGAETGVDVRLRALWANINDSGGWNVPHVHPVS